MIVSSRDSLLHRQTFNLSIISEYRGSGRSISTTAGDFALRGKPIWLYVADIDEYTRYSRELYVNPLDTPYWCARTPSEMDTLIRQTTAEKARENCREILEYYGTHETGRASEEAARYITSKLEFYEKSAQTTP